jgi:hypothetical protein
MFLCGKHKPKAMKKHLFTIVSIALSGTVLGQCLQPSAEENLDINNSIVPVRNTGTIWFDNSPASALHSLWVGGKDVNGQVKIAAMRFGQVGNDYYPGPLNTENASIGTESCAAYDRIWKLEKWQVDEFRVRLNEPRYSIPDAILNWPAHGDISLGHDYNLAPYYDVDSSGSYDPFAGDYPFYDFDSIPRDGTRQVVLRGEQTLWWVINDAGGEHTESGGTPIGIEVRCMAYGFNTCGPLADVTFYEYEMINRGAFTLLDAYVGLWVDMDAGFAQNDRLQCDVGRSLGYVFDTISPGGNTTYAVGVNILGGPYMDNDGQDSDGDGIVDNEKHPMTRFITGSNGPSSGDPNSPEQYYNNLAGRRNDGTAFCYGGNGEITGGCNGIATDFMFPGNSDPTGIGTGGMPQVPWFDDDVNLIPFDRRLLLSAGPFTLQPGEVNDFHYAVVRAFEEDGSDPVPQLLSNSDLTRSVYDGAFLNMPCCPPDASIAFQRPDTFLFLFASVAEGQSYQWYFGDGQTSTERFPTHTYATYGTYNVCLNVTNACGVDIYCETVDIALGSTSIADVEAQRIGLTIHPNPTSSGFHIALSSGALLSVALTDALGRSILSPTVAGTAAFVPTYGLAAGIYFATVVTSKGTAVQRVVVQ